MPPRILDSVRDDEPGSIFAPSLRSTTIGLLVVITFIAFEDMAVSPALPTAARELHGLGAYGWAFSGMLVATIVGMVVAGQYCDRFGAGRPMIAGLLTFLAGLVLAGTATTMTQLIAGRVVSGLGGGLLITSVYVLIGTAYPDRLRPAVFTAISSAWVVPSLVGPIVAGAVAQHLSWRWVFLALAPVAAVGGALVLPVARRTTIRGGPRPRGAGALVVRALAVAGGIALLEQAGQHPSVVLLVACVAGLAVAAWGVRRLVPAGTFVVRPGVPAVVALRGLLSGALFGIESVVPLSLQLQHGYSATLAGLPLTASGLTWGLGSWWQGRAVGEDGVARRIRLLQVGFGCVAVAAAGMAGAVVPGVPAWLAFVAWAVGGFGAGLAMASLGVLLLRYTTDETRGADSAALQLADGATSAMTTGLGGVLVAAVARGAVGSTAAFVTLDLAMSGLALAGALVARRARAGDARPGVPESGPAPPVRARAAGAGGS